MLVGHVQMAMGYLKQTDLNNSMIRVGDMRRKRVENRQNSEAGNQTAFFENPTRF